MDVIDYAIRMELDGKAFYEKSARETKQPELKKILQTLAEEEEKHYRIFKMLKEGDITEAGAELKGGKTSFDTTRTMFKQMAEERRDEKFGDEAQAIWREAMRIEEEVEKMYREKAETETDPKRKELIGKIADEEKRHIYLIDNIRMFMHDPQSFADSANFRNFMSWEGR